MIIFSRTVAEFQFSQPSYDVSEDSGVVSVCLELISGILTEDVIIEVMVLGDGGMFGCKLKFAALLEIHFTQTHHAWLYTHSWKWKCIG